MDFVESVKDRIEFLIAQLEKCPTTGKLHAQVGIGMKQLTRATFFHKALRYDEGENKGGHPKILIKSGTVPEFVKYHRKEETRVPESDGGWRLEYGEVPESKQGKRSDLDQIVEMVREQKSNTEIMDTVSSAIRYLPMIAQARREYKELAERPMEEINLRPWQEEFLLTLKGQVKPRRIFWVNSPYSGVGKSSTMRYFMCKKLLTVCIGDVDMRNFLCAYKEEQVIWFDLPRDMILSADVINALELLSNTGYLHSGKYQSTNAFVWSHIVVTSNREPPHDRLPNRIVDMYIGEDGYACDRPAPQVVG